MTNLEIEQIRLVLMTKCIIIVYIISIPFKLWLQNRALKKINTLFGQQF